MRILHIVHQYPPEQTGGTELYTRTLAERQAVRGHEVSIFYRSSCENPELRERRDGDVRVFAAGGERLSPTRRFLATFHDPLLAKAVATVVQTCRPELVHIQHLMGLPIAALDPLRAAATPCVVTLHDYWWVCANAQLLTNYNAQVCAGPALYFNCARCALARVDAGRLWPAVPGLAALLARRNAMLRGLMAMASQFIAPTNFVRDWYARHGMPAERICVLAHGTDRPAQTAPLTPIESAGAERAGLPDATRPVRFAVIGGIAWQKGLHVLVEAFNGLRGVAELWIAGPDGQDLEYAHRVRAGAGPRVRFLGPLSHEAVWGLLAQVDALAVPSLWYETFSLIVHEAQAAGVPVLASGIGALAEAVRDGVDGLLVEPGNVAAWKCAMQGLVDNPGYLAELRRNIRQPLSLAEHASRMEAIYAHAMAAGRTG